MVYKRVRGWTLGRVLPVKYSVVFPSREFQSLYLFALVRSAIETRLVSG